MSKQDLLLHHVSCYESYHHNADEQEIIEYFTEFKGISLSEIKETIAIHQYKPVLDENHDIPTKWISLFMDFVRNYSLKPNPLTINQYYFNKVLTFLNGADLVKLELALGNIANSLFEDYAHQYIQNNPVLGVVLNTDDLLNFPCYQTGKNYKFLYHLLFAYPNLSIIGGQYADKQNPGLSKKTCLSMYSHRKYLTEKALKGGGLAFVFNIFNRIILNAPSRFPPKPKQPSASKPEQFNLMIDALSAAINMSHQYGINSIDGHLNDMHIIPKFDEDLCHFMCYFSSTYLYSDDVAKFKEKFVMEHDDDDEDERKFEQFIDALRYEGMCKFVETVRPKLPDYPWDELLTQHLGMVAYGNYECVPFLMNIGAKINLSGKIQNDRTCDVITEALYGSNKKNAIKTLIEMFKRAKEKDFVDEDEKVSDDEIRQILNHFTNYQMLRELVSTLLNNSFVLSVKAETYLKRIDL